MDRFRVVAAAAAAWAVVAAAAIPPDSRPRSAARVRPIAAHRASAGVAWAGADRVYEELDRRARGLGREERTRVARVIIEEAVRSELAPLLVLAVIHVESRFDARAVSPVGAVGLMQLMPPTMSEELSRSRLAPGDPFDPITNVRAGVRYLARLVGAFRDVELALMAYNAGPNRLRRHLGAGRVPSRLLGYPRDVLARVQKLAASPQDALAAAPRSPLRPAVASAHVRPAHRPSTGTAVRHRAVPPADEIGPATLAARRTAPPAEAFAAYAAVPPAPAALRVVSAVATGRPAPPLARGAGRPRPPERPVGG
jgi:soluble lytic murein transglycosylase-like protein